MKQRYISLVLSVVVLFLSAGVLYVRGQQFGPSAEFPGGLVAKPLDTGDIGQPKENYLAPTQLNVSGAAALSIGIKMKTNQAIVSGANSMTVDSATNILLVSGSGNVLLTGATGNLVINTQGVVLPSHTANPTTPIAAGMIYFDSTAKKVKLNTTGLASGWTDIGTGTGSSTATSTYDVDDNAGKPFTIQGSSGSNGLLLKNKGGGTNAPFLTWDSATQKFSARLDGDTFYMGAGDSTGFTPIATFSLTGIGVQKGWVATGNNITSISNKKEFSFFNNANAAPGPGGIKIPMSCDTTTTNIECTQSFYADNNGTLGDMRYDQWYDEDYTCPSGYIVDGTQCCRDYWNGDFYDRICDGGNATNNSKSRWKEFSYGSIPVTSNNSIIFSANMNINGDLTFSNNGKIRSSTNTSPYVTGFVEGNVGNWATDDLNVGNLPNGFDGSRCITFMQGFRSEFAHGWDSSIVESDDGDNHHMGSLAACWLGGAGDNMIHGSYAGDDYGVVDGYLRCGYLCW